MRRASVAVLVLLAIALGGIGSPNGGADRAGAANPLPPKEYRVVVYIQGIDSHSSCFGGCLDRAPAWLDGYLSSQPAVNSKLDVWFRYFSYSGSWCYSEIQSPWSPWYDEEDTCDGVTTAAAELKDYIELQTQGGVKATIIAHSMGGLVAAYLVAKEPDWARQHIASVVTFDSPLKGVPNEFLNAKDSWPGATACHLADPPPNSMQDLKDTHTVVIKAQEVCSGDASQRIPFFTIDATHDDVLWFETVGAARTQTDCDRAQMPSDETHSGVWDDATTEKKQFVACAVMGAWPCTLDQKAMVYPGEPAETHMTVPDGVARVRFVFGYGSVVRATLVSSDGTVYGPDGAGPAAGYGVDDTSETYVIQNPAPGTWTIRLRGVDVPSGGEDVSLNLLVEEQAGTPEPRLPSIDVAVSPPPNAAGWNNTDVTVDWTVTGATSTSGCNDTVLTQETAGTVLTCTASNSAGTTQLSTRVIKIDKTPPVTTATLDPPAPNGERGWYKSDVTVALDATDPDLADGSPGSGVDSTQCRLNGGSWHDCRDPFPVADEGWNQVDFYSTDVAGNVEGAKNVRFKLDKTPPDVSITEGILDGLHWDQVHLERGILTNSDTLGLSGNATDNLCLWEVRAVDRDSGNTLASQQPPDPNQPDWPPPYPAKELAYSLSVPLHTGINNIDVVAEDCAGWEKAIFIQIVYVVPGPYDPRSKGFWYDAVKTGKYSETDFQTLLDYTNVVSDTFGPAVRNIYGPVTLANYRSILSPATSDMETLQKAQLLGAWLNLVSGRAAVLTPADLTRVRGWAQVVDNTGGSPLTFALNVPMEVEEVDQTRLATRGVYEIAKNLAEAFNMRRIIP